MRNILFYSIIIFSAFVFANCKKESYDPDDNKLIVVDQNGNTTICKPVDGGITGYSSNYFEIYTTGSVTPGFDFHMGFSQGIPTPLVLNQSIRMYIRTYLGEYWVATKGAAQIHVQHDKNPSEKCPKFAKVSFNNIQFIRELPSNSTTIPDTLLVSGIISVHRGIF